jgi:hypothetical protein
MTHLFKNSKGRPDSISPAIECNKFTAHNSPKSQFTAERFTAGQFNANQFSVNNLPKKNNQ